MAAPPSVLAFLESRFAENFFDVIVSMDAYHYFGTDELYLGYITRYLKPRGQVGIVVPGLRQEFGSDIPNHLQPYWEWEFYSFHSPEWWKRHWEKTGLVTVKLADLIEDGWEHWMFLVRRGEAKIDKARQYPWIGLAPL